MYYFVQRQRREAVICVPWVLAEDVGPVLVSEFWVSCFVSVLLVHRQSSSVEFDLELIGSLPFHSLAPTLDLTRFSVQ